jgi:hypothetical protein
VNGDGRVNADDYFAIDSNFLSPPARPFYAQGDFNGDGVINADDYFLIDSAFLGQGQPLRGGAAVRAKPSMVISAAQTMSDEPERKAARKRRVSTVFSDRAAVL